MATERTIPVNQQRQTELAQQRQTGALSVITRLGNDLDHAEAIIAALEQQVQQQTARADAAEKKLAEATKPAKAKKGN